MSFLAADQHGTSSIAVTADSTQTLSKRYTTPIGTSRGQTTGVWPNDEAFLGMPADSGTGLTHIGAREYDPSTGQFISVVPLLTLDQHQSLSGYVYANNNPTTFSDPSGLGVDDGTGHSEPHPGRASGHQSPTPGIPAGGTGPGGCYHQCGASSNNDSGVTGDNRDSVHYAQEQIYAAVSDLAATPEQREAWLGAHRAEMQKQYESGWMVDANTAIAEATNICFVYKEIGCSQEMKDYLEDVENTRVQGVGSY